MTIQQCSSNEGAWLFGIAVAPATLSQFGPYVFFLQEWAFASRGIFGHSVEQCLETLQSKLATRLAATTKQAGTREFHFQCLATSQRHNLRC